MKKKGFTLIELMAIIVILAIIALITVPMINETIKDARKKAFQNSVEEIVKVMKNYAYDQEIVTGKIYKNQILDVTNEELHYDGKKPEEGKIGVSSDGEVLYEINDGTWCARKLESGATMTLTKLSESGTCDGSNIVEECAPDYTDAVLNGTDPVLGAGMIPVSIASDGTVTKVSTKSKWFDYTNKQWANAVLLADNTTYKIGDTIPASSIKAYFVWIPKYSYQLFDLGAYTNLIHETPTTSKVQEIQIRFGITNTLDSVTGECKTPMTTGATGECQVGDYMTHPAFLSLGVNGFWVGKFETTGSISSLTILPDEISLRNQTVGAMYNAALSFDEDANSHMMKNTEWGAVAILSHSKYGINGEIRINNNSSYKTGYAAADTADQSDYPGTSGNTAAVTQPYNTSTGVKASTTGNITGVYDMSGGAHEYMAAFMKDTYGSSGITAEIVSAHPEYFDFYESEGYMSFNERILGDATGEIGPFYHYDGGSHNTWYADHASFVRSSGSWFLRGGHYTHGVFAGQFYFGNLTGNLYDGYGFRLVLAPQGETY